MPEKRRRLVTELTPRLVDSCLIVQRDMFNRIVKAALGAKRVGRDIDDEDRIVPSHSQLKRRMQKWHNAQKTPCGLPTRVSHPKRRRSWSLEHIARLLNSPVYTGTSSKVQRWRPAKTSKRHVIRDALYWVPLFMICLGVRPEEILQPKIRNVRRRDGVICLFLGDDADERLKTGESRRILPVPQLLLDLGFREWAIQRRRSDEIWAFPEIAPSEADGRPSQIFGDRMRTLLGQLKLRFSDEDIYAMRRTLPSKLLHLKVDRGVRQRILGHLEGTTIDRHYSDDGLQDLKDVLDRVDYGIRIGRIPRIKFPVITGCNTPLLPSLDIDVSLSDEGELAGIELLDADTDEILLAARIEGVTGPKNHAKQELPIRPAKDVAEAIVALQASHTLALPADEAVVAAIEHLLILADSPACQQSDVAPATSSNADTGGIETLPAPDTTSQQFVMDRDEASSGTANGFEAGDTAICVFPLTRRGNGDAQPRPGLVVGAKSMNGRRYLDIAQGFPADAGTVARHQIAVADPAGLASAGLKIPTCFDLRRRILVAETDSHRIHCRLGTLDSLPRKRLPEALSFVGDISPDPLCDRRTAPRAAFQVERRSAKAINLPRGNIR